MAPALAPALRLWTPMGAQDAGTIVEDGPDREEVLMISSSFCCSVIRAHALDEVVEGFKDLLSTRAPDSSISYQRVVVLPSRVYKLHLNLLPSMLVHISPSLPLYVGLPLKGGTLSAVSAPALALGGDGEDVGDDEDEEDEEVVDDSGRSVLESQLVL